MPKPKRKRSQRAHVAAVHSILVGIHTLAVRDPYLLAATLDWIRRVVAAEHMSFARQLLLTAPYGDEPRAVPYIPESIECIYQDAAKLLVGVVKDSADAILRSVAVAA